MKVEFEIEVFRKALAAMKAALKAANTDYEPNLLLHAKKNVLEISASTAGTLIVMKVPAETAAKGECTVNVEYMYSLKLAGEKAVFEAADGKLKFYSAKSRGSMALLDPGTRIQVPEEKADTFTIPYTQFLEAVKGAHLTPEPGIETSFDCKITVTKKELSITTLGGDRRCCLCRYYDAVEGKVSAECVVNVDLLGKLLASVNGLVTKIEAKKDLDFSDTAGQLEITIADRAMILRNQHFLFMVPRRSSDFPDLLGMVAKLSDKKFQGRFKLDCKPLEEALAVACSIPRKSQMATDMDTVFEVDENGMLMVRSKSELGSARSRTETSSSSGPVRFGMYDFYFKDVLRSIPKSSPVTVEAWKGLVLVRTQDDPKKPTHDKLYWLPQMEVGKDV